MLRIREVESTQAIGDLRQKIAELEIQVMSYFYFDYSNLFFLLYRIKN